MPRRMTRSVIDKLESYIPGKPVEEVQREYGLQDIIKMASNENPWGVSPRALQAMRGELRKVYQYPEGSCLELRQALARRLGVTEDMITISNGADNVLMMIAQAFVEQAEEAVMATPTFPIYKTAVLLGEGVPVEISLRAFTHDLEAMASAIGPRTKLLIVCNPNNPTGTMVTEKEVRALLDRFPPGVLLILDEVYGDFTASSEFPDAVGLIWEGRPVIAVRSFSKLYGLAGVRVGYAVGSPDLIQALNRVREPFPVNRLGQAAALAALGDEKFRAKVLRETRRGRDFLSRAMGEMGLTCLPSHTNFLFVNLGRDGQGVHEALLMRGIIIRPGRTWRTPTWCRITVGTPEQNQRLVQALGEVIGQG